MRCVCRKSDCVWLERAELSVMGVPFHKDIGGRGDSAFLRRDTENRTADTAVQEGAVWKQTRTGRSGADLKPEDGAACLLFARLPKQEEREAPGPCPDMQAAAFTKPQTGRIASHLQYDCSKGSHIQGRLRNPQGIFKRAGIGQEKMAGGETVGL